MRIPIQLSPRHAHWVPRIQRLVALSCALFLTVLATTGCDSMPTAPSRTPTPRITPTPTRPGITRLPVSIAGAALPSPDGTMLAGADPHPITVTIYTLQGKALAHADAPPNEVLGYSWLPDSSRLLIWPEDPNGPPGPISLLSPDGAVQSTGLQAIEAAPSPDGTWIASQRLFTSQSAPSSVEVVPRQGGAVHVLASGIGVRFLGWLGADVIYAANGNIYAISPSGDAVHLLVSDGGVAWRPPDGVGPMMSPDGQVLFLFERHHGLALLVGSQILPLPQQITFPQPCCGEPLPWAGPHQLLGFRATGEIYADVEYDMVIVDMVSGAVVRETGAKAPASIQALSGEWVGAWASVPHATTGTPDTLHFTNLRTKREVDLGPPPNGGGGFYSLGQGKFFLHGGGESYLLDPAAAGAP